MQNIQLNKQISAYNTLSILHEIESFIIIYKREFMAIQMCHFLQINAFNFECVLKVWVEQQMSYLTRNLTRN